MTIYPYQLKTPNQARRRSEAGPRGIIVHYTAGGSLQGTLDWFMNRAALASAHRAIGRDGLIMQMVADEDAAWHSGSKYTRPMLQGWDNLNDWTLGAEVCNWGALYRAPKDEEVQVNGVSLRREEGNWYCFYNSWTVPYHGPAPALPRYWFPWLPPLLTLIRPGRVLRG
jgi:N-acetyl-anhydromuramyl-L-alanine amidase AmpD